MAAITLLVVGTNGRRKRQDSSGLTPSFTALQLGADNIQISQSGSGAGAYFDFGARELQSSFSPANANSLANKAYVDAVRVAARIVGNIKVATTANITLSGPQTIDGYSAIAGDKVLVKNQTDPKENGVYTVSAAAWSRSVDMDNSPVGEIYNGVLTAAVLNGTAGGGKNYVITSVGTGTDGLHVIGTDNITWSLFTTPSQLTSGAGTTINGNAIDVDPGEAIRIASDTVAFDFAKTFVNDNASPITVRQVVYEKSNGAVDLAGAGVSALADSKIGFVEDASIASAASGRIAIRPGKIISGFSGLTPGAAYYVSKATPGAIALYSAITFVSGDFVYKVGQAVSATELLFEPSFEFEF